MPLPVRAITGVYYLGCRGMARLGTANRAGSCTDKQRRADVAYRCADRIVDFSLLYRLCSGLVFWFVMVLVMIYDRLVFRLRVVGRRHLIQLGRSPAILISNHSLYFDPAIIADVLVPQRTFFSALYDTFRIPYLGSFIRYLGAFPIPTTMALRKLIPEVREMLARRQYVHVFPEGNLEHLNTHLQPFEDGAFFLAHVLGVPVVPISIVTKPYRGVPQRWARFAVSVTVVLSEPIHPKQGPSLATAPRSSAAGIGLRAAVERMRDEAFQAMQRCIEQRETDGADSRPVAPSEAPSARRHPSSRHHVQHEAS